jgi:hypothetical protein
MAFDREVCTLDFDEMKYEIEHDEETFFKAAKSKNEQVDFGQEKSS